MERKELIRLSLDELVMICASELVASSTKFAFEDLVATCFNRFPEKFGLPSYPQWPDSARVNKCWLRCRSDRGWLRGSSKSGFQLTAAGKEAAECAKAKLAGELVPTKTKFSTTISDACEKNLANIRDSIGFRRYQSGDRAIEREQLMASVAGGMDMPRRLARSALRSAQNCAKRAGDAEVLLFLRFCEKTLDLSRPWSSKTKSK